MKKTALCFAFCFFSMLIFAQTSVAQENRYTVTITYADGNGSVLTSKINVLASSATEAENKGKGQWEALKQGNWTFRFANADRTEESTQPQAVAQQTIGYLQITNNQPWPTDLSGTKMWVEKILIKPSGTSDYDSNDYNGGSRLGTNKTNLIGLQAGTYDIKVQVFRNWFDMRVGDMVDTIQVESRNIVIREGMITDVSMRGGGLTVSQPRNDPTQSQVVNQNSHSSSTQQAGTIPLWAQGTWSPTNDNRNFARNYRSVITSSQYRGMAGNEIIETYNFTNATDNTVVFKVSDMDLIITRTDSPNIITYELKNTATGSVIIPVSRFQK